MDDVVMKNFARKAYRCLLIAYQDFSIKEYEQLKA